MHACIAVFLVGDEQPLQLRLQSIFKVRAAGIIAEGSVRTLNLDCQPRQDLWLTQS